MAIQSADDWAANSRMFAIAWGLPTAALILGSYFEQPIRAALWTLALLWMGSACIINARRCGRTHCRYTGPYYLIMIVPVVLQGIGILALGGYAWWAMGLMILLGGKIIWWSTERIWGKYVN